MARLYKNDPKLHARAVRALENLAAHTQRGVLDRAHESGTPLILTFVDGTQRKTTIQRVEPKRFATAEGEHDKIEVMFAIEPKAAKKLKRVVRRDEEVARLGLRVSADPDERLRLSKMLLQRLIDESLLARFTFVVGTVLACRVRSFGYFEVNAELKGGGPVVLFRHGLYRVSVGDDVWADQAWGHHVQGR
ncbi:MAG: hypothetical protein ACOC1F_07835 [Myxococcota bacterium]